MALWLYQPLWPRLWAVVLVMLRMLRLQYRQYGQYCIIEYQHISRYSSLFVFSGWCWDRRPSVFYIRTSEYRWILLRRLVYASLDSAAGRMMTEPERQVYCMMRPVKDLQDMSHAAPCLATMQWQLWDAGTNALVALVQMNKWEEPKVPLLGCPSTEYTVLYTEYSNENLVPSIDQYLAI